MSIIRGTPRPTIVLCTCIVLACSLHAFSSNWRTRNAKTLIKGSAKQTAWLRHIISIYMPQHIATMEHVNKIWHREDAGGHKYWELTGAAVATFHEAQIRLYKTSYTVSSYRFIYLLVI